LSSKVERGEDGVPATANEAGLSANPDQPTISVVLPAYNEESVIAHTIERVDSFLRELGRSYEILLGDDGSADGTIAEALAVGCQSLRVIARPHRGKGAILSASLADAMGVYVGFIDADMEIDVGCLKGVLELLDSGADGVIGRKTGPSTRLRQRPMKRRLLTFLYNLGARALFGTPYRDHQAGMKFFRRPLLQRLLPAVVSTGWTWDTELLIRYQQVGAIVKEVPVQVTDVPNRMPSMGIGSMSLTISRELLALWVRLGRGRRASPLPDDLLSGS
jgi:dolichyl-phosphate beta-glucosyltransferase